MTDPIVVTFFNSSGLPLAGLTPTFASPGYYKTAAGLSATPPPVIDGGDGDYGFTLSDADLVTGIRYLLYGGAGANPQFLEGEVQGVPLPQIPVPVVVPVTGKAFNPSDPPTWTADDINTLKAACASGVLTVVYDGPPRREVTYQSLPSMRALLAEMISQVKDASGTRSNYRFVSFRKGV